MDEAGESKILESFNHKASQGEVVVVGEIHKKYEEVLQRQVNKSAIYKLLHRHNWRKVSPRPHHPNENKDKMEAFKKTLVQWLPPPTNSTRVMNKCLSANACRVASLYRALSATIYSIPLQFLSSPT